MATIQEADGYRVLSLDGGGIRGFATLVILKAIMNALSPGTKPCEYFHFIAGAGIGGILALLLGRLQLGVSDCMMEYWRLSSTIARRGKRGAGPPLFDAAKLRLVMDDIVRRHTPRDGDPRDLVLRDPRISEASGWEINRTCIFAKKIVNGERVTHCFRTYKEDESGFTDVSITDAAVAVSAAEGLFEEATLYLANHQPVKFMDKLYPLGLTDPVDLVQEEFKKIYPTDFPGQLFSIGPGRVAFDDIGDLLRLGTRTRPRSSYITSLLQAILEKTQEPTDDGEANIVMIDGEPWSPEKVTEHLDNEYKQMIRDIQLRSYRRFEIKPVPDVGPNDFLSLKEVGDAVDEYLDIVKLPSSKSYLLCGNLAALCWALCTNNNTVAPKLTRREMPLFAPAKPDLLAAAIDSKHLSVVQELLSRDQELPDLFLDLNETHWDYVLDIDERFANETIGGLKKTLLQIAAEKGHTKLAQRLVNDGFINLETEINRRDRKGKTALYYASSSGANAMIKLLLEAGADIDKPAFDGLTPLQEAIGQSRTDTVQLLLQKGATPQDGDLHLAITNDRWLYSAKMEMVKHLLQAGAVPRVDDLHLAIQWQSDEIVQLLLDHKTDVNATRNGQTALNYAVNQSAGSGRGQRMVELLLSKGADVNARTTNGTALHEAILEFVELRDRHIGNQAMTYTADRWAELLQITKEHSRPLLTVVELLLDRGADADARDDSRRTALHRVVIGSEAWRRSVTIELDGLFQEVIELLINNGASVEARDGRGMTVLDRAIERGSPEFVRILVTKGKGMDKKAALERALRLPEDEPGKGEIIEMLRDNIWLGWESSEDEAKGKSLGYKAGTESSEHEAGGSN
ncbi:ankyrin repeat-containing domain protein [Hypoxylon sp. FL1284]|nr:ankyrin repeat-containing domain protein [Hypoxylon sp. FL1284]